MSIDGLSFNGATGSISGRVISSFISTIYTVTCYNGFGHSSVNLNFTYIEEDIEDSCMREGNMFIQIIVYTTKSPSRISFIMYNPDNSILLSLPKVGETWENNNQYYYAECVPQGIYSCTRTTTHDAGWDRQAVEIQLFDTVIANLTMSTFDGESISNQLYCIYLIYYSKS